MYKLSKSDEIELQIQKILKQESSTQQAVEKVLHLYTPNQRVLTFEELERISVFLFNSGFHIELNQYLSNVVSKGIDIPWGHYCESIFTSSAIVSEGIKSALIEGADHSNNLPHLSRSYKLDFYDERLKIIREQKIKKIEESREKKKKELLSDYQTLQAQGLTEDANEALNKLHLLYSDDPELDKLLNESLKKRKHAASVQQLEKKENQEKEPYIPIEIYQELDQESQQILSHIEQSIQSILMSESEPTLIHDLVVALIMIEDYSAALALTPSMIGTHTQIPENTLWVRYEILFQMRKFVELLEEIKISEQFFTSNPDATIALNYLKALCYWELDEKTLAIQTMESILFIRPQYKSAALFLHEWKSL